MLKRPAAELDLAMLFVTERAALARGLRTLQPRLQPAGMIWVAWPKRASKVPTDITEDVVREVALPRGLVDVKVCAIDEVWSGLKLVIRKELRTTTSPVDDESTPDAVRRAEAEEVGCGGRWREPDRTADGVSRSATS